MKKMLFESSADLEAGIVKSLEGSPLSLDEIQELEVLQVRDLMVDNDLDYLMAEKVLLHVQKEKQRMQNQKQLTRADEIKVTPRYSTRVKPINEKVASRIRQKRRIKRWIREALQKKVSR
jgi:hypothetical protein